VCSVNELGVKPHKQFQDERDNIGLVPGQGLLSVSIVSYACHFSLLILVRT